MSRAPALLICLIVGFGSPHPAGASPDRRVEEAKHHFELGRSHHELGEYDAAIAEFRKAYLLQPLSLFLFNIAQSYRRAGKRVEALDFYRRFIARDPAAPQCAEVEAMIAELEGELAAGTPQSPSTASPAPGPPPAAQAVQPATARPVEGVPSPRRGRRRAWPWVLGGSILLAAGAGVAIAFTNDPSRSRR
jgi:tetratricopeptide (TPR) repeat protein